MVLLWNGAGNIAHFTQTKGRLTAPLVDIQQHFECLLLGQLAHTEKITSPPGKGVIASSLSDGRVEFWQNAAVQLRQALLG